MLFKKFVSSRVTGLCYCWISILLFTNHWLITCSFGDDCIKIVEACLKEFNAISNFLWLNSFTLSFFCYCSTKDLRISIDNVQSVHEGSKFIHSDNWYRSHLIFIACNMYKIFACIKCSVVDFTLIWNQINCKCKPLVIFPEVWYHINKNIWVLWPDTPFNLFAIFAAESD